MLTLWRRPPLRLRSVGPWLLLLLWMAPAPLPAEPLPLGLVWQRLVQVPASALAADDSLAVAATPTGVVFAWALADGASRWQHRGLGPVRQLAMATPDQVLALDAQGRLEALRADTGQLCWRWLPPRPSEASLTVADSVVLVASADGWLRALRLATGQERWRVRTGPSSLALSVVGDYALTPAVAGWLAQIDVNTGRWRRRVETPVAPATHAVVAGGLAVVPGADGRLRAYRTVDLAPAWTVRLPARLRWAPLAAGEDWLICIGVNDWVYGVDARRGTVRWRLALVHGAAGPAVVWSGRVLVPTADGGIVCLQPASGPTGSDRGLVAGAGCRLCAVGEHLLVGAADGRVYALAPLVRPAPRTGVEWETWQTLSVGGRRIGYVTATLQRLPDTGGWRLRQEQVSWGGAMIREEEETWTDASFGPRRCWRRRREADQVWQRDLRWEGEAATVVEQLAGVARRRRVATVPGATPASMALLRLGLEHRLKPGRVDSVAVVEPASLSVGTLYVRVDSLPAADGHLRVRLSTQPGVDGWLDQHAEVDAAGAVQALCQPLLGREQTPVEALQALAWVAPPPLPMVRLDLAVGDPGALDEVRLRPRSTAAAGLLAVDARQWISGPGPPWEWVLRRETAPTTTVVDSVPAWTTQPTLLVDSDNPAIVALAQGLTAGGGGPWGAAQRCRDWVRDHLEPAASEVRLRPASAVAVDPSGSCGDYAVLLLALCRALGVPSRASAGFLVDPAGILVPHLWVEVWAGAWRGLDATLDEAGLSAAHVALAHGDLVAGGTGGLDWPVALVQALCDTIDVVSWQAAGTVCTGVTERLWQAATTAADEGQESLATASMARLAATPGNRHRDAARLYLARRALEQGQLAAADSLLAAVLPGDQAGPALYYRARVAQLRGDGAQADQWRQRLVTDYPDEPLAAEALGQLAEAAREQGGCRQALPWYRRLVEEHAGSGWAVAARAAMDRCGAEASQPQAGPGGSDP